MLAQESRILRDPARHSRRRHPAHEVTQPAAGGGIASLADQISLDLRGLCCGQDDLIAEMVGQVPHQRRPRTTRQQARWKCHMAFAADFLDQGIINGRDMLSTRMGDRRHGCQQACRDDQGRKPGHPYCPIMKVM